MAQLGRSYYNEENNDTGGFTVLPEGDYTVQIVSADWKDTKAKNGRYINLQLKVVDEFKKGSVLFDILNLDNPNPQAVEISEKRMNQICEAVGKQNVEDTDELLGIPMMVRVVIEEQPGFGDRNKITRYSHVDGDTINPWK